MLANQYLVHHATNDCNDCNDGHNCHNCHNCHTCHNDAHALKENGFCKVVVLRPSAQKEAFAVQFSRHELAPGPANDFLFRAITARVPFAEWAKMESYCKFMGASASQHNRRARMHRSAFEWPSWRDEYTKVTEESARDRIYDVQYELYNACIDPDENYEWTVVIYART